MKASALQLLNRFEIPEYAKGDQALWTPSLVKETLVEAHQLLRRVSGRVGPGGLKAAWPEYFEPGDYPPEQTKTSPYGRRMTITRMEMVLLGCKDDEGKDQPPWLAGVLLDYPDLREKLQLWVMSQLRGESSTTLCLRKRWALASMKRHRDRAAGIIAQRLNRAGLDVW